MLGNTLCWVPVNWQPQHQSPNLQWHTVIVGAHEATCQLDEKVLTDHMNADEH